MRGPPDDTVLVVGPVDQHPQRLADPLLGALRGQLLGQPGNPRQPLGDHIRVDLVLVRGGLGAVLVGVAEDADGIEPGLGDEALQLRQVALALAGEADDEVGAGSGLRRLGADRLQQLQEAVGAAEAPHRPQHTGRRVLEGQIEVGRDLVGAGEHVDQAGPQLRGLEVADPDPLDAVDGRQLRQQRLQQADVAEVLAVGGVVLGDQHDLLDALPGQPARLPEHIGGPHGR